MAKELWEQSAASWTPRAVGRDRAVSDRVARVLRRRYAGMRIVAVEPPSRRCSVGARRAHGIEGVGPASCRRFGEPILPTRSRRCHGRSQEWPGGWPGRRPCLPGLSSGANVVAALAVRGVSDRAHGRHGESRLGPQVPFDRSLRDGLNELYGAVIQAVDAHNSGGQGNVCTDSCYSSMFGCLARRLLPEFAQFDSPSLGGTRSRWRGAVFRSRYFPWCS